MDTSSAKKIATDFEYSSQESLPNILSDQHKSMFDHLDTSTLPKSSSDINSGSINHLPLTKTVRPYSESIHSWFMGRVTEVSFAEQFFVGELLDIEKKKTIVIEFDIDSAFDDENEAKLKLYVGASFTFYILTKHGPGSPQTTTGIEFTSPYFWSDKDNEEVERAYHDLFRE